RTRQGAVPPRAGQRLAGGRRRRRRRAAAPQPGRRGRGRRRLRPQCAGRQAHRALAHPRLASLMLLALPPEFAATRDALHAVAEQVVSAAYFHATSHIGLRPAPRGFGTPVFGDNERVRVDATALVHERAGVSRRHELTTLQTAAAFVGVPLGAPAVYT